MSPWHRRVIPPIKSARQPKSLFTQKGYGRITTRDIAAEAGVNLALLNYYFRSKEELFNSIMLEVMQGFMASLKVLLNDEHDFEEKLSLLVNNYFDLLIDQPNVPIFIMSEIRSHPSEIADKLGVGPMLSEASFFRELASRCPEGIQPFQLFLNLISMTVFPFIAKPIVERLADINSQEFNALIESRRQMVPAWFMSMLEPPKGTQS